MPDEAPAIDVPFVLRAVCDSMKEKKEFPIQKCSVKRFGCLKSCVHWKKVQKTMPISETFSFG